MTYRAALHVSQYYLNVSHPQCITISPTLSVLHSLPSSVRYTIFYSPYYYILHYALCSLPLYHATHYHTIISSTLSFCTFHLFFSSNDGSTFFEAADAVTSSCSITVLAASIEIEIKIEIFSSLLLSDL